MTDRLTASQRVFDADLARFDAMFQEADAVRSGTDPDGTVFHFIDPAFAAANVSTVRAYKGLLAYGYATGLMP